MLPFYTVGLSLLASKTQALEFKLTNHEKILDAIKAPCNKTINMKSGWIDEAHNKSTVTWDSVKGAKSYNIQLDKMSDG